MSLRATEYVPLAIHRALKALVPMQDIAVSRFGGIDAVAKTFRGGRLTEYTTADVADPILDGTKPLVRWYVDNFNRPDTLDFDLLNLTGQTYITVECYSPLYTSACRMVDDILGQFNRDGVLSEIVAQHDEDVTPGRKSDLYAHVVTLSIQGGFLPEPSYPRGYPMTDIGLMFGESASAEWLLGAELIQVSP